MSSIERPAALDSTLEVARSGKLYPAVILHGADETTRRSAALELARCLLCEREPKMRPCGACRHCRRIELAARSDGGRAAGGGASFHPDVAFLERDLKTSTSADATRAFLQPAQLSPFEARGQVFVVVNAESLTPEAANALLKVLEEPPVRAPRTFLLLAPSRLDLLATLRSRSLSVFLGPSIGLDPARLESVARRFADGIEAFAQDRTPAWALALAEDLDDGGFEDPRSMAGWAAAAAIVRRAADLVAPASRRMLLDLAHDLLNAIDLRQRGIPADRILEGWVSRRLSGG